MTKANGRILGSVIALSLVMGATGTARAGINPQGINPQGINPQGINPQGINPQGINPQGISLDNISVTSLVFANGTPATSVTINGSQLTAYKSGVYQSGTALIGATLYGLLNLTDALGDTYTQIVTLYIADVKVDTTSNTMVCDPMDPTSTPPICTRKYYQNTDVYLYKILYYGADPSAAAPLCAGDQNAMLFKGTWAEDGAYVDDASAVTVSCTGGVLSKCARSWGYKPWRYMTDKHNTLRGMRGYHQACLRAATADYSGIGFPMTVTGTMIDLFDNGGFNIPATQSQLTSAGFGPAARFESIFTSIKMATSIKPDYWGKWTSGTRYNDLPQWEAMYDYPTINWDGEVPKHDLSELWAASSVVSNMESRYAQGPEIAVFNPVWSATGNNLVPQGSTATSFNHDKPSCVSNSNAPDRAHRWTAPQTGTYQISTTGSSFDTVLYVYRNHVQSLCNDDANGTVQSSVNISVTAGDELTIFVDGYGTASGSYALNINWVP